MRRKSQAVASIGINIFLSHCRYLDIASVLACIILLPPVIDRDT